MEPEIRAPLLCLAFRHAPWLECDPQVVDRFIASVAGFMPGIHVKSRVAPTDFAVRGKAGGFVVSISDRPLTPFNMYVKLIGWVAMYAFPLARLNHVSLHDQLVVLKQYFTGNIRVIPVTGIRRAFTVMVRAGGYAQQREQQPLNSYPTFLQAVQAADVCAIFNPG